MLDVESHWLDHFFFFPPAPCAGDSSLRNKIPLIGVRGLPKRDISSLGAMGRGAGGVWKFFRRRRRRRRRPGGWGVGEAGGIQTTSYTCAILCPTTIES